MAILDIHDLGLAREQGSDLVGVMAVVQRPLAAVLAQPAIRSPADLEGERAGVTGLPSDEAVLRSIVRGRRRRPRRGCARRRSASRRSRRCSPAASPAPRRSGTSRASRCGGGGPAMREFRVDDYGAPAVPGAGAVRDARRRWRTTRRSSAPRSARCSAATARSRRTPRAPSRPCRRPSADLDRGRARARSSTRSRPPSRPARPPSARCARDAAGVGRWDLEFGILAAPLDVERAFDTTLVTRPRAS